MSLTKPSIFDPHLYCLVRGNALCVAESVKLQWPILMPGLGAPERSLRSGASQPSKQQKVHHMLRDGGETAYTSQASWQVARQFAFASLALVCVRACVNAKALFYSNACL